MAHTGELLHIHHIISFKRPVKYQMGQVNSLFDKRLNGPYLYFIANDMQDKKEKDERTEKDRVERLKSCREQ